jgi:beta-glucosidase
MDPFFFGASTSSQQVEGGNHNDWSEWEMANAERLAKAAAEKKWPEYILARYLNPLQKENYISGLACDHYHRFREDFDIAKSLGHNAHRFSIEWSRIEPEEGKFDEKEIKHYREVISALRERGIEPFVTIWHWTLPLWLTQKGGLQTKEFPEYFARYAEKLAKSLPDVRFWITLNEPEVVTWNGYGRGIWPPNKTGKLLPFRMMRVLARAHRLAYHRMKAIIPKAQVGATMNMQWFESIGDPINNILAYFGSRLVNFYFLNRIVKATDFIGCNYYFHKRIAWGFNKNLNEEISDMGWEICPEGIYHVLKDLKKYQLPIYIMENGVADARDAQRESFIMRHLDWMRKVMDEGVDVRGYFHWSLLDNFEWASGFWPRFGLVEIDYKTLERKARSSALAYKKIIEQWHER